MVKRTGPTHPYLRKLIEDLKKKSFELNAPIWREIAEKLEKPRRQKVEVNLTDIERNTVEGDVVVVPGVVLGNGTIKKPLTIAAWRFSLGAKKKIEKAGGKAIAIEKLLKSNPRGSGVRILT